MLAIDTGNTNKNDKTKKNIQQQHLQLHHFNYQLHWHMNEIGC